MPLRLRKIFQGAALLAAVLVVVLVALGFWWVRRPWPQYSGTMAMAGLEAEVEVVRDRWGVPHIYADNERDLIFAQGYVHAQDRLWQMESNRMLGSGSLSKVLGRSLLRVDRHMRTLGLRRAAARDWETIDHQAREMLEVYAAGVNHFIETHRDRLPLEFTVLGIDPQPWEPIDSLTWSKVMSLNLSLNDTREILRMRLMARLGAEAVAELLPPYPQDAPTIVPAAVPEAQASSEADPDAGYPAVAAFLGEPGLRWGSNSWVVHGSRTATGRPLLANDTHLTLGMPSAWYENGLHGGRFNVVGFSFAGMPLVVIGHNNRVAWGITSMYTDVQDYYVERLDDSENPSKYEFQGQWRELERVPETIEVKGDEPVEFDVVLTHHGPIMNQAVRVLAEAEPMALGWTALDGGRLAEALIRLNLAGDWHAFLDALSRWDHPSVNFVYADVDGNIGYQGAGKAPLRVAGDLGLMPKPGWTGEFEWQGFVPFDEMPRSFNPPAGFIVTANHKVVDEDYPHQLAYDFADPYRAQRITEVLAANDRVTIADLRALHADVKSLPAAALRPYLLAVEPQDELQQRALAELETWDLELRADSPGASIYQAWLWSMWAQMLGDELGDELFRDFLGRAAGQVRVLIDLLAQGEHPWFDNTTTAEVETRDDLVRRSLAEAVAWLSERYGDDPADWQWGTVHPVRLVHLPLGRIGIGPVERIFNSKPLPAPGDIFAVNAFAHGTSNPYAVTFGVSQRLIVDLGDLSRSLAVNSTGQCAHAFHPHREDQIADWNNVDYHPLLDTREAVEAEAEATLTLVRQ